MIDTFALWAGYAVMLFGGVCLVSAVLIGAAYAINFAVWRVVGCLGGLVALYEFGVWRANNKDKK